MDEDLKILPVRKIFCPKCGELMAKIYPVSSIILGEGQTIPNCRRCIQKYRNSLKGKKFVRDIDRLGWREA